MVKAKIRLGFTVLSIVLGCVILIKMTFNQVKQALSYYCCVYSNESCLQDAKEIDEYGIGSGLQLRKLNQPFSWHTADDQEQPSSVINSNANDSEPQVQPKQKKICRNSVQGRMLMADDQGSLMVAVCM